MALINTPVMDVQFKHQVTAIQPLPHLTYQDRDFLKLAFAAALWAAFEEIKDHTVTIPLFKLFGKKFTKTIKFGDLKGVLSLILGPNPLEPK